MILKQFMTTNPVAVCPDDSMDRAAQIMAWTETQHLPVTVGDGRLVGIISERGLLGYRLEQPYSDPKDTPLSQAMHTAPQTAGPESSMTEVAARLAQHEIGCLPVTDKGKLVGFVTRSDVLAAEVRTSMGDFEFQLTAADVMTESPWKVGPEYHFLDAARLMQRAKVRHLPVVDENSFILGILSDRIVSAVIGNFLEIGPEADALLVELKARDAMYEHPLKVLATDTRAEIADLFVLHRASAVLVATDQGVLQGIVSYIDLLRSMSPEFHPALTH
jgi:CBS domain-containing protein